MHDLNTISRLNAEAHAQGIKNLQDAGLHVVANYTGLTLLNFEGHVSGESAFAAARAPVESPDQHRRVFVPNQYPVGARDQSEDRATA